ncbi:hypothetical protein [Aliamphritea spongicola]|uniref:hypothetical protein n=1 Tax=Aliamphritea spongicola TaxID=707589 RepID=UPI00196AD13D|nr:hypothetical protein [Aliamphritea spongicola]MBN3563310.1 hypothetical protein [Aliamphritea spongicola]
MENEYRISMQQNYFCLCLSQIKEYESICEYIEELNAKQVSENEIHIVEMNLAVQYERRERAMLAPIVFAAMCIEAFVYDYGASHLGDAYIKKYLDKLDITSKLVVVTDLVTGEKFPTEGQAFEGLKNLVKSRNSLVHFKSKKFDINDLGKAAKFRKELNDKLEKSMYESVETIRLIMKEMDRIHGFRGFYEYSVEPLQCHA